MTISARAVVTSALFILITNGAGLAQEGYPLDGTWRGEWGQADGNGGAVVIVMQWDGEKINGTINPGPNSTPFSSAALEPSTWTVRIDAAPAGGPAVQIEGTLRDIGSYNRYIEGTWSQAGTSHDFRITRE